MSLYIYRRSLKTFKRNNFDLIAIYVCDIVYYREIKNVPHELLSVTTAMLKLQMDKNNLCAWNLNTQYTETILMNYNLILFKLATTKKIVETANKRALTMKKFFIKMQ